MRRMGIDEQVLTVVNKVDNPNQQNMATEFYSLGFPELYPISANTGGGTGELLDAVINRLPKVEDTDVDDDTPESGHRRAPKRWQIELCERPD